MQLAPLHNGYLAEFCDKSLDTIMQDTDRDFFMSAAEAKEYGLIDHVIANPTDIAVAASGIPMYAGDNL
jgi:ATP-dependent Clp protease protease subunit